MSVNFFHREISIEITVQQLNLQKVKKELIHTVVYIMFRKDFKGFNIRTHFGLRESSIA